MSTNAMLRYGAIGLLALGVGCVDSGAPPPSSDGGNAELGIAEFRVQDSATETSVIGLDAKGQPVARMELTHGRFELSGNNRDGYDQFDVDGRRLHVEVGAQKLHWETEGYEPTMQMPAHPAGNARLAAFLDDPHVKPVLDRWQIGFQATSDEPAYWSDTNVYNGVNRRNLYNLASSTTWASTPKTYNTCGGSSVKPTSAWAVGDSGGGQTVVAQCCPPTSGVLGGSTSWFGLKSCPHSGTTSMCGTASTTCKACAEYPVAANDLGCAVSTTGSNPYYLNYAFTAGTWDVPGLSYGNTLQLYNQIPEGGNEVYAAMDEGGWTFTDPWSLCYSGFTSNTFEFTCTVNNGMHPYLEVAIIRAVHSDGRTKDIEFNIQPY